MVLLTKSFYRGLLLKNMITGEDVDISLESGKKEFISI